MSCQGMFNEVVLCYWERSVVVTLVRQNSGDVVKARVVLHVISTVRLLTNY